MSRSFLRDYALEVPRGNVSGVSGVNKFGKCTDIDQALHDVWDLATQAIWLAPTQARTHDIVSSSASDDGDPAGVGARTLRIYGLTGWAAAEVSEDITMNGQSNVATANSYVIIHRMKVLTKGATNVNVGIIKATAQTDNTITAQINAGEGRTHMAIYGVPSTQKAYLTQYYAALNRTSAATVGVDISLRVNPEPDAELTNFLVKHTKSLQTSAVTEFTHPFNPYYEISGPAIIKVAGIGSADNNDVDAGFDLYLVNN